MYVLFRMEFPVPYNYAGDGNYFRHIPDTSGLLRRVERHILHVLVTEFQDKAHAFQYKHISTVEAHPLNKERGWVRLLVWTIDGKAAG